MWSCHLWHGFPRTRSHRKCFSIWKLAEESAPNTYRDVVGLCADDNVHATQIAAKYLPIYLAKNAVALRAAQDNIMIRRLMNDHVTFAEAIRCSDGDDEMLTLLSNRFGVEQNSCKHLLSQACKQLLRSANSDHMMDIVLTNWLSMSYVVDIALPKKSSIRPFHLREYPYLIALDSAVILQSAFYQAGRKLCNFEFCEPWKMLDIETEIPAYYLSTIIRELFKNAIMATSKHCKSTPSTIIVSCDSCGHGSSWFDFTVWDLGGGIDIHKAPRYGWTSSRLDHDAKHLAGFGFGLAVIRFTSLYLGGKISVNVASGIGTKINLRLPIRICADGNPGPRVSVSFDPEIDDRSHDYDRSQDYYRRFLRQHLDRNLCLRADAVASQTRLQKKLTEEDRRHCLTMMLEEWNTMFLHHEKFPPNYAVRESFLKPDWKKVGKMEQMLYQSAREPGTGDKIDLSSLSSLPDKQPLEIRPVEASDLQHMVCEALLACDSIKPVSAALLDTVRCSIHVCLNANGGVGFVISSRDAVQDLRNSGIEFPVADKDHRFPKGYMTERLSSLHVCDEKFLLAVQEFSDHANEASDRWPPGHIASGLPKDGYTILADSGRRLRAAVKLAGLPVAPFEWNGVGTRHMAALSVAWALRNHVAVVIVRSDSGGMHVFCTSFLSTTGIVVYGSMCSTIKTLSKKL